MAHNIEIVNGIASFAENGRKERAWHNLGQVFDRPMTVKEALEASHADYKVEKKQLIVLTPSISEAMSSGSVPTEDAEEKAIMIAGSIPLKNARGLKPPRPRTLRE